MKQGWEYKKLKEIGTIVTGNTPSTKKEEYYSSDDYCFVKPSDLPSEGFTFLMNSEYHLSSKGYEVSRKLPKGSVLVSCIGIIGKTAILGIEACTNQQINAIIPHESINSKFLAYSILSQRFKLSSIANAPVVPLINKGDFSNITIPIPSLDVQQSIVSELDKINKLIRLKKEQLSDYDKLAQSLFYQMFGDPVENEKGWDVKKLGEVYKVSSSKRIMQEEWTKEGVPFLKVSDIVSKIKDQRIEPSTFISEDTYSKLIISGSVPIQNDILITSRGTLGLCYIVKNDDKFYFQDGMITWLSECKGNIIPLFLTYLFKNNDFLQHITSKANKSTVAYISISQLSKKRIPLPPLPLQQLFAQRIEMIERLKAEIQSTIADLETLLASRMQYWFD